MPVISIIIPTYNRAHQISIAIQSILNQTFADWECIVVDDGSLDDTESAIKKFKDERVQYYKLNQNKGACFARNYGILKSKGEYIAFQDSDDYWEKDKLEKQLIFLQQKNLDLSFCRMRTNGNRSGCFPENSFRYDIVPYEVALSKFTGSTQTFFGKRSCFLDVQFDEKLPRFQDWELIMRMTQKYRVGYQREILVQQNLGSDSISSNSQKGIDACRYLLDKYREELKHLSGAKANLLVLIGTYMVQCGSEKEADQYFREALKLNPFSARYVCKFILNRFGLLKKVYS